VKKGTFISIVQNPETLSNEHIPELKRILLEFPYFSTAHALLTKAYHENENINFEQQLRKTAAFALDRKRLHELLFSDLVTGEIKENESTLKVVPKEQENKIVQTKPIEEKALEKETDPFEAQILSSAISNSILQEVKEREEAIEKSKTKDLAVENQKAETSIIDSKSDKTIINFDKTEPHTFGDWLNYYSDKKTENTTKVALWRNTSEVSKSAIKAFSLSKEQKKNDFYSASKMAKLSVQEDDDLVTETLAKIYANQGNYEKAIKAYKKLQLKYPEKKVYFAAQINALKNNLNS